MPRMRLELSRPWEIIHRRLGQFINHTSRRRVVAELCRERERGVSYGIAKGLLHFFYRLVLVLYVDEGLRIGEAQPCGQVVGRMVGVGVYTEGAERGSGRASQQVAALFHC
jgi:hypothetical protein